MTAAAIIAACLFGLAAVGSSVWDRRRLDAARARADTSEAKLAQTSESLVLAQRDLAGAKKALAAANEAVIARNKLLDVNEAELRDVKTKLAAKETPAEAVAGMGK